jgi:hypothetical protein
MRARQHFSLLAVVGLAAMYCSCAYVAPPLPPSLMIPVPITNLSAIERGDRLIIDFTVPATATDGAPLQRLQEVDLRVGAAGPAWDKTARRVETSTEEPGPVHVEVPVHEWVGQDVLVRVRAAGKHGRFSEWSNSVHLKVLTPLAQPIVKAEPTAKGVRLTWTPEPAAAAEYRILKQGPTDQRLVELGSIKVPEYTDTSAEYGKAYQYAVEAFVKTGDSEAQSVTSPTVSITPEDHFPPAVPSGVTAITGISAIELSWTPDTETDLRGYILYRAVGDGPFQKLGGPLDAPAYSDHAVEAGKRYRYAVSAVDQIGNESEKSAVVEATAP